MQGHAVGLCNVRTTAAAQWRGSTLAVRTFILLLIERSEASLLMGLTYPDFAEVPDLTALAQILPRQREFQTVFQCFQRCGCLL